MAEHSEIEEHIHHAQEPFDKIVAGTMAIIAALLAVVSVMGQHFNTQMLLSQQKSADEWAFYQGKNIRRYSAEVSQDVLTQLKASSETIQRYANDGKRYDKEMKEISEQANHFEKERDEAEEKATRFHIGEVLLEIGIVLSSLAILTKRKPFYLGGSAFAAGGVIYACFAFI